MFLIVLKIGDNLVPDSAGFNSIRECFFPGFLYEDNLAQWMIGGGELSNYKRPYEKFETNIANGKKKKKLII